MVRTVVMLIVFCATLVGGFLVQGGNPLHVSLAAPGTLLVALVVFHAGVWRARSLGQAVVQAFRPGTESGGSVQIWRSWEALSYLLGGVFFLLGLIITLGLRGGTEATFQEALGSSLWYPVFGGFWGLVGRFLRFRILSLQQT